MDVYRPRSFLVLLPKRCLSLDVCGCVNQEEEIEILLKEEDQIEALGKETIS